MEEFKPGYHQNDVRDFILEVRIKTSEYSFNQVQLESIQKRLKILEEMVEMANELEKGNGAEYPIFLHKLIIEKSRFFLFFDDLILKKTRRTRNPKSE